MLATTEAAETDPVSRVHGCHEATQEHHWRRDQGARGGRRYCKSDHSIHFARYGRWRRAARAQSKAPGHDPRWGL